MIGHEITELTVGPEDEGVAERILQSLRQTGKWEGDFWVRRRDGSRFLAHVADTMVPDEEGAPAVLVGISQPAGDAKA